MDTNWVRVQRPLGSALAPGVTRYGSEGQLQQIVPVSFDALRPERRVLDTTVRIFGVCQIRVVAWHETTIVADEILAVNNELVNLVIGGGVAYVLIVSRPTWIVCHNVAGNGLPVAWLPEAEQRVRERIAVSNPLDEAGGPLIGQPWHRPPIGSVNTGEPC